MVFKECNWSLGVWFHSTLLLLEKVGKKGKVFRYSYK